MINQIIYALLNLNSFAFISFGWYRNLKSISIFLFDIYTLSYLFKNLITPIFVYIFPNCLPIHDLGPPLNPPTANEGTLLHSFNQRSGLNSFGFS